MTIRTPVRLLAYVAALVAAGCATAMPRVSRGTGQTSSVAYLRGLILERSDQLPAALREYQAALARDRESPLLHVRIGGVYLKMGQTQRALQAFDNALALDPGQPEALRWIAMLYASEGQLEKAIAAYERLIQREPDQTAMSTLADLYVLSGALPKAVALYHRLIDEFGSSSQLHFNLGILYGRLGQYRDSIEELSRAFELSPDSVEVRVAIGLTYELDGQFDKAAALYEDAIRLDPFNPRLYHHAARALLSAKRYAESAAEYQAVLDLVPSNIEAIMGLVRVWMAQDRFDDATRFLGKKLEELGQPPELYVALGIVYREAKQAQEAMRAFQRAIDLKSDYAQAHFYLAAQLDQLGRRDLARKSLLRTLAIDANHPDAMNYLGYLDAEAGVNLEEAKRLIERALQLDPDNGAYVDSLGWVYYKMGRLDDAIAYLERASRLLDSDPVIFDHLGDAYFKQSDVERAMTNWRKALKLNPELAAVKAKLDKLVPDHHEAAAKAP